MNATQNPFPRPLQAVATALLALTCLVAAQGASAHRQWLLPSATVLSGDDQWVSVDAAVSNDLFYPDHFPMRLDNLVVTGPDGARVEVEHASTGKYRSVFDLPLAKPGTYRIASTSSGLFASWKENGQPKRWRGNAEGFAREVPKDAAELRVNESSGRVETFVTRGKPTPVKPTGQGLEIEFLTQPNDLVAGEAARFRLLADGKPAAGIALDVVPGGSRYRNLVGDSRVTSGGDGTFSITWPSAGMYWIGALTNVPATVPPAKERRMGYAVTLEVLPQ